MWQGRVYVNSCFRQVPSKLDIRANQYSKHIAYKRIWFESYNCDIFINIIVTFKNIRKYFNCSRCKTQTYKQNFDL